MPPAQSRHCPRPAVLVLAALYLPLPLLFLSGHGHGTTAWVAKHILFLPGCLIASSMTDDLVAEWWQSALVAPFVVGLFMAAAAWRPRWTWLWILLAVGYSLITVGRILAIMAI